VVFIGGGFEVIHAGHIHTITQAKSLGDVLVVVLARDATIRKRKGRDPVSPESARLKALRSLRQVDAAILGVEGDIYDTLQRVGPDVVALGYDQHHQEEEIVREAKSRGIEIDVVRLDSPAPSLKTTRLLQQT
jgi:FAD synthetase